MRILALVVVVGSEMCCQEAHNWLTMYASVPIIYYGNCGGGVDGGRTYREAEAGVRSDKALHQGTRNSSDARNSLIRSA